MEHIIKSLRPAALVVAAVVVFALGIAFLIAADGTLAPSTMGASSDLAQAARWLQFLAALVALAAVCWAGWELVLRSEWTGGFEIAAAALGTMLIMIGLLASAASNGGDPAAAVIVAVGIGIWALLVLSRAARTSLAEQAAHATARKPRAELWLAAAVGLLVLAIGYGFTSAAGSRGPGIAAGVLEAAGVGILAGALVAARERGYARSRPVPSVLAGLALLAKPAEDMRAMRPAGQRFLAANPGMALHHMHDPVQDRLMIAGMAYFRVKFRQLPEPYRVFLAECLEPGGTVVVVDCTRKWPVTTVGDRHVFQFGVLGGATEREFQHGSSRVVEFLRRQGARRDRWLPPIADQESPEAEWGFAEPLAAGIDAVATELGLKVERLRFGEPEDASPLIAELFRHWYTDQGLPSSRLIVSSFLLMDPMLTIRTRSVPYWALFGTQPSLDRLTGYLSGASAYDDIRLTVFPHGARSIGLPSAEQWRAATGYARRHGEFVAVHPDRYPRHFRALTGFHHELSRLPRAPAAPMLTWDAARRYLAAHATSHNATFGADRSPAR